MRLCSLFAGIGGFDLAAHWMGWATAVFVEWEEFPRQVLIKNFKCVPVEQLSAAQLAAIIDEWRAWVPGLPLPTPVLYGDICHFDATAWAVAIDLVCGGFPCQPFSSAGAGLGAADARHLWPQMLRVIRAVRPLHVVGENVRGLLTKHPLQFEAVCADLEAEGYDVQPFLLPAAGVGAPHERYRFWFVAHTSGAGGLQHGDAFPHRDGERAPEECRRQQFPHGAGGRDEIGAVTNAQRAGREESYAPSFAAEPRFSAGRGDAWATSNTPMLGCYPGQSGSLCQRAGQGAASQRDEERAGLRPTTDGCSTVSADATGQRCGHGIHGPQPSPAGPAGQPADSGSLAAHPDGCGCRAGQPGLRQRQPHTAGRCETIAHPDREREPQPQGVEQEFGRWPEHGSQGPAGYAPGVPGHERTTYARHRRARQGAAGRADSFRSARAFRLTEPPLRRADDGLSARLVRAAGNSKAARRIARRIEKLDANAARNGLKGYGNAVVPQLPYQIFQAIDAA